MARLRSRATGVVVNVSDESAADLQKFDWEPAGDEKPAAKRAAAKSDK